MNAERNDVLKEMKSEMKDLSNIKDTLEKFLSGLKGDFGDLLDEVKKCSSKGKDELEKSIEGHPFKSVAMSAAIGFLVGFILHNSHRNSGNK